MDPFSQAFLGGAAAQSVFPKKGNGKAWIPGIVGGLLPDADVLIQSPTNPLLYIEYHRHFTHALSFIPIGGILAALPFLLLSRWWNPFQNQRWVLFLAALIGYATHGILDATTSYGTLLLWPFSNYRVAWDILPIVDPLFTGILFLGMLLSLIWKKRVWAVGALLLCLGYAGLGVVQKERALSAQKTLAKTGPIREKN